MVLAAAGSPKHPADGTDPWDEAAKETERKAEAARERERLDRLEAGRQLEVWKGDFGRCIQAKLEKVTQGATKQAPDIGVVIDELSVDIRETGLREGHFPAGLPRVEILVWHGQVEEVTRLKERYAKWTPIKRREPGRELWRIYEGGDEDLEGLSEVEMFNSDSD